MAAAKYKKRIGGFGSEVWLTLQQNYLHHFSWNQKLYTKFIENISDGVTVSTFELILSVVVHGLHGYIEIKIPFALVLQW